MRYLLLICADEDQVPALGESEGAQMLEGYRRWIDDVTNRGLFQGGARLRPTTDATTVRVGSR